MSNAIPNVHPSFILDPVENPSSPTSVWYPLGLALYLCLSLSLSLPLSLTLLFPHRLC